MTIDDKNEEENEFKKKYLPMLNDPVALKATYEECVAYLMENKEEVRAKLDAGDLLAERLLKAFVLLEQTDDANYIVVLAGLVDVWKFRKDIGKDD